MGNRYFFEYGALQERTDAGPRRLIECDTSALPATTISEAFAIKIADALNLSEDGMGNDMLAMREALESLGSRIYRDDDGVTHIAQNIDAVKMIDDALAAPLRHCDLPDANFNLWATAHCYLLKLQRKSDEYIDGFLDGITLMRKPHVEGNKEGK